MATKTIRRGLTEDRIGQLDLRDALKIDAASTIRQAIDAMCAAKTGCALVTESGELAGIFTERDFLHRVIIPGRDVTRPVTEVMTPDPHTLSADDRVWRAIEMMQRGGYRHLPVVESDGMVSRMCNLNVIVSYLAEYFPDKVFNLPPQSDKAPDTREGA